MGRKNSCSKSPTVVNFADSLEINPKTTNAITINVSVIIKTAPVSTTSIISLPNAG